MLLILKIFIVTFLIFLNTKSYALRCRTEDGPSDSELKRISRNCMKKISDGMPYTHNGSRSRGYNSNMPQNNFYGQAVQTMPFYYAGSSAKSYDLYDYDEHDSNHYNDNNNNNNNNNYYQRNNNGNSNNNRERERERSRDQFQLNRAGATLSQGSNNNERSRFETHNTNTGQRSSSHKTNYNNSSSNNNNESSNYDPSCIVHCFFQEMNMLDKDDFPEKHKTQYMLTKDIRDRELRNFYIDTIQECFRLLESQRRRDKCFYSRELVNCMMEYARANCEDWEEYTIIFN